ncbi:MAG TPA: serine/threonine-protein kinase [Vicinamibacteria bacterium]|nr:serine/threonine-protein kinase [Vicinamibacteria bacterium]
MNCPSCRVQNVPEAPSCAECGTALPSTPTQLIVTVDLRPGVLFDSRYEILGPLGHGGMGVVYKARDRSLDEVVAIKVLRPDFAQDPHMAERFKSEIKMARRVRHRNVCAIHDYGEAQGLFYISMEYLEGVDLKHQLRDRGAFPAAEAYEVAIQIAEGLQAVHEAGIIHRDLKTPNIMRDAGGVARLMDFGIAKREGDGTRTATGHIVGTPEYMSPEQAQGHRVDFRSDIYALGIVVYEIFTGRVPFRGETPISTILKHLHDPPPLDPPDAETIPVPVRPVLRRCLAKSPDDRFPSAREVADALRGARSPSRRQQPVPTSALQAPTVESPTLATAPAPPPVARRSRLQPWLLVVPLMAVAGGALVVTSRMRPASPPPTVQVAAAPQLTLAPTAAPAAAAPPLTLPAAPTSVTPLVTPAPDTIHASRPVKGLGVTTRPPSAAPIVAAAAPPATLPAATVPPSTLAAEPGQLQVAVRPWGEVSVDGRVIGTTPLDRITLPVGTHVLRVRHPLYELWERPVSIRSGETAKVVVDLPTQGVRKQP